MAYSRGKIKLTNVQGNVEIIVHASPISTPTVNLFDKNDPNVSEGCRINSSGNAVTYASGQLVTGYIVGAVDDKFSVATDGNNKTNCYTGMISCYSSSDVYIGQFGNANSGWTWGAENKTGTFTIPATGSQGQSLSSTAKVRFCLAYTNIDNITITKS